MKIENISIDGLTVARAIKKYYPQYIELVEKQNLYNYLLLFGIRFSTCDTSLPDDFIGGIRLEQSFFTGQPYWNWMVSNGTTDPTPKYLVQTIDKAARLAGGTAWVKEGQYIYYFYGNWQGYPAFAPKTSVQVYRWMPSYKGEKFDPKKAKLSTSIDTMIHRTWAKDRLFADSAGCQSVKNNALLIDLARWAKTHRTMYKENSFTYTLLTKEQFVEANKGYDKGFFFKGIF